MRRLAGREDWGDFFVISLFLIVATIGGIGPQKIRQKKFHFSYAFSCDIPMHFLVENERPDPVTESPSLPSASPGGRAAF